MIVIAIMVELSIMNLLKQTRDREMVTVFEKAKEIVANGMNREEVYSFFDRTNKDITQYIGLFQTFGINQNVTWDLYEDWQAI